MYGLKAQKKKKKKSTYYAIALIANRTECVFIVSRW